MPDGDDCDIIGSSCVSPDCVIAAPPKKEIEFDYFLKIRTIIIYKHCLNTIQ